MIALIYGIILVFQYTGTLARIITNKSYNKTPAPRYIKGNMTPSYTLLAPSLCSEYPPSGTFLPIFIVMQMQIVGKVVLFYTRDPLVKNLLILMNHFQESYFLQILCAQIGI